MSESQQEQNQDFAERLLAWFEHRKRDLPWRKNKNPYYVWVSEIMLQQTRVETVIPYFERFITRFPTMRELAEAPEDDVLKMWEGLGYYSRARNLQAAVREVQATYGGKVPDDVTQISKLKGIGPYTAGAILSIAYNQPEPAVDGNVLRVMARHRKLHDDIAKAKTRVLIEKILRPLIPRRAAGDFTQALMELGSLVCTPKNPKCEICPVVDDCLAKLAGMQSELPIKTKAKQARDEYRAVALIQRVMNGERQFLLRRRAEQGLLAGLWECPHIEHDDPQTDVIILSERCRHEFGVQLDFADVERLPDFEHLFSHIHWHLRVYRFSIVDADIDSPFKTESADQTFRWVAVSELHEYTLPLVFSKIIRQGLL